MLGGSAPVCTFRRKENVSNSRSRKTMLYVEPKSLEEKETTRKTKLRKYETTCKES